MPLKEMVQDASEIAVAASESLYGKASDGSRVYSGEFRTGPGLGNVLVSRMKIIRVLRGNAFKVGEVHDLDFWPMWHMSTDLALATDRYPVILMFKHADGKLVPVFSPEPWIDSRFEKQVRKLMKGKN